MDFSEVIRSRRTHKLFDNTPVPREKLEEFLKLAVCAPNHRRNEPWNFLVVEKERLLSFFDLLKPFFDSSFEGLSEPQIQQKKEKLSKLFSTAGALIYISSEIAEKELVTRENYAATCCAIQNLMLAATRHQIGSFWSTNKVFLNRECHQMISKKSGFMENSEFAGAIFLGNPTGRPSGPEFDFTKKTKFFGR